MLSDWFQNQKERTRSKNDIKEQQNTPEAPLALITATKLTHENTKWLGLKVCPSYKQIQNAMKLCYLPDVDWTINESLAEAMLQSIVGLTIKRLGILQDDALQSVFKEGVII